MIFDTLLYASLTICFFGISYRIIFWTIKSVGYHPFPDTQRLLVLTKSVFSTIFSPSVFELIKSFIIDVLLQGRILKTSRLRWVMHILIFIGFMALVLMHALDSMITENLFSYYYSTLNPFFFLRSLFGLMVITGLSIAVYRRYILKPARLKNARSDLFAIMLILSIILSGMVLEGIKMTSVSEFSSMVEEYAGLDYEDEDVLALEAYWVKEFALVSPRIKFPFEPDLLVLGIETHETNCMDCHSPNKSAFLGYAAAKLLSPVALFLDKINGVTFFYFVHILSCFISLALVPFGKMFHIVASPISLLTRAVQEKNTLITKSGLTKQLMELDACTHCSTCNSNCSAGMLYESVQNDYILPSQKILALKKAVKKQKLDSTEFEALFQGLYLCTNCDRCTVVCPCGINLKSLWFSAREILIQQNVIQLNPIDPFILTGFSFTRGLNKNSIEKKEYDKPLTQISTKITPTARKTGTIDLAAKKNITLINLPLAESFSHCFGCQNCTTICPVVANFEHPEKVLTILPHQIMYSLGLGLVDLAKGSAMIWNCLSCYQCQENCPQNVSVCDILFALKNLAFKPHQEPIL